MAEEPLIARLQADLSQFTATIQRGMTEFRQQMGQAQQAAKELQQSVSSMSVGVQQSAGATVKSAGDMRQGFTTLATQSTKSSADIRQATSGIAHGIAQGSVETSKLTKEVRQGFTAMASTATQATKSISAGFATAAASSRQSTQAMAQGLKQVQSASQGTTAAVKQVQSQLQAMGTALQSLTSIEKSSAAALAELQRQTVLLGHGAAQSGQQAAALGGAWGQVRSIIAAVGLGVLIREIGQLVSASVQASQQLTNFQNAFATITGSTQGAAASLQFVRAEANRLGVDFTTAAQSFQGLAAGARGTALEGEGARKVFTAVAEAARVMGLSTEQTGGALTAITQIISKGTVQSEELRGQLSERIPGAFQIAARAMGVTTAALGKMLEQGLVLSDDFLPKFARQLQREFAGGVEAASRTFQAEITRMQNAITALMATFGDFITKNPAIINAVREIGSAIAAIAETALRAQGPIQSFFTVVANAAAGVATIVKGLAGDSVTALNTQIAEMDKVIAKTEEQLENQKKLAALPLVGGLASGLVERNTALLAEQKAAQEQLRVARIEAMRMQAGMGRFVAPGQGTITAPGAEVPRETFDDLGKFREQTLAGSAALTDYRKLLADIGATKNRLKLAEVLGVDTAEVQVLRSELTALEKKHAEWGQTAKRAGVDAAKGIENTSERIRQLQAYLANPPKNATPGEVEQARNTLNNLLNKQLPEAFQGFAKARQEAEGLQRLLTSGMGGPMERLAIQRQLDELNVQQLPEALQGTARLQAGIADLQRTVDEAKSGAVPLDLEQLHQLELALLKDKAAYDALQQSLENRLLPEQFAEFTRKAKEQTQKAEEWLDATRSQIQLETDLAQLRATSSAEYLAILEAQAQKLRAIGDIAPARDTTNQVILERARLEKQTTQTRIDQEFQLRQARASTAEQEQQNFEDYIAAQREAGVSQERIQEQIFENTKSRLEAETQAWKENIAIVQDLLAEGIFNFIEGKGEDMEDVFKKIRESAIKAFSQDLSKNITGFFTSLLGGTGLFAGGGRTGTGTGSTLGGSTGTGSTASGFAGTVGSWLSGLFGGTSTSRTPINATTGQAVTGQPTTFYGAGMPVQGVQYTGGQLNDPGGIGGFYDTPTGGSATSFGGVGNAQAANSGLGGQGGSLGAAFLLYDELYKSQRKWGTDFGSSELAGARAGTIAGGAYGFQTAGVYGAIIGAVIGGILGGLEGAKEKGPPMIEMPSMNVVSFRGGATGLVPQTRAGNFIDPNLLENERINADDLAIIRSAFRATGDTLFGGLLDSVKRLPKSFQNNLVDPLNSMTQQFKGMISDNVKVFKDMSMEELMAQLKDYLENDVPRDFQRVFGTLLQNIEKIGPVADTWQAIIETLQENERRIMAVLQGARQSLHEALFTPAQVFEARQTELQELITRFETGGDAEKLALAPQISALTQEVFALGRGDEVLGQDLPELKDLQKELGQILKDVQGETKDIFKSQADLAQQQIDILMESLTHMVGIDGTLQRSLTVLERMDGFFQRAFSGNFAEGGRIEKTGLALVHQGETVLPARRQAVPFVGSFQHGGVVPADGVALVHRHEIIVPVSAQRRRPLNIARGPQGLAVFPPSLPGLSPSLSARQDRPERVSLRPTRLGAEMQIHGTLRGAAGRGRSPHTIPAHPPALPAPHHSAGARMPLGPGSAPPRRGVPESRVPSMIDARPAPLKILQALQGQRQRTGHLSVSNPLQDVPMQMPAGLAAPERPGRRDVRETRSHEGTPVRQLPGDVQHFPFLGRFPQGGAVPQTGIAWVPRGAIVLPAPNGVAQEHRPTFRRPAQGVHASPGHRFTSRGTAPMTPVQALLVQRSAWERQRTGVNLPRQAVAPPQIPLSLRAAPFVGRFARGGVIPATGLAVLHAREQIIPGQTRIPLALPLPPLASPRSSGTTTSISGDTYGDIIVNLPPGSPTDPKALAREIGAELDKRDRLRQWRPLGGQR